MGRPYLTEISELEAVYSWAHQAPTQHASEAVRRALAHPLISVGSGGALAAARFAADLHLHVGGRVSRAMTPQAVQSMARFPQGCAALVVSAGGRNADIRAAFQHAVDSELPSKLLLTARDRSPLVRAATESRTTDIVIADSPAKRDGFLATGSLFAFDLILYRSYAEAVGLPADLPASVPELTGWGNDFDDQLPWLRDASAELWNRQTLLVLHGAHTRAAAYDIESRFAEAALQPVLVSDFRNFAHGRHHWLAKLGGESGVLAVVSPAERRLAKKTLEQFPEGVAALTVPIPHDGPLGAIAAQFMAILLAQCAGEVRGIDPGRPGVPDFGRKLYSMRASIRPRRRQNGIPEALVPAIERKAGAPVEALRASGALGGIADAASEFIASLESARFGGVIVDYDGTVRDRDSSGLREDVAEQITALLEHGVPLAVATGRGKSVADELRASIGKSLWPLVLIGHYNGGLTRSLDAEIVAQGEPTPRSPLALAARRLEEDPRLGHLVEITARPSQVTIESRAFGDQALVRRILADIVSDVGTPGLQLVESGHSFDIVTSGVSKLNVVEHFRKTHELAADVALMLIGDRGHPGENDYSLLRQPLSLSVDHVAPSLRSGWNLAPRGLRGPAATLWYFSLIRLDEPGMFGLKFPG